MDCVLNRRSFRVLLEQGEVAEEIGPRLAWLAGAGEDPLYTLRVARDGGRARVWRDGACIASEEKSGGARAILLQEMTRLCVEGRQVRAILHAGACGNVLLAGTTHAGKSTLCAALMAAGVTCYGDDSAVLDEEFRVAGMPFPLMLRRPGWPVLAGRCREPDWMWRWGTECGFVDSNLPVGASPTAAVNALIFVQHHTGETIMEPVGAFEALLRLKESGFWVAHERESIGRFVEWVGGLRRYQLTYSSIDEAVCEVQKLLGQE